MVRLEGEVAEAQTALLAKIPDADIESARSALKQLLVARGRTYDDLEAHRALFSPIRRIPPELLGEIFFHCLPAETYIRPSAKEYPLLFTQISSTWRAVALATPALWTSLAVNLSTESCTPALPLIHTWLARSGSCLLSFYIVDTIRKDEQEPHMTTSASVLALYAPHYNRWQNVRLEYLDWRVDTGFAALLPCADPPRALESLHLARDFWRPNERAQLSLMLSAPRLRDCTWISNTDLGKTFHASFPQLSRLFLERPLVQEDFMHILGEGANLEACQFFVLASSPLERAPGEVVLRHNLRSLDITADLFGRLFAQLELPHLTDFSVRRFDVVPHHVSVWPHAAFLSLLARSGCVLRGLSLTDMDVSPAEMREVLRAAAVRGSLERLVLWNDRRMKHTIVDDEVLRLLTWAHAEEQVCPRLASVKFWGCQTATDGRVADMVQSRWRPQSPPGGTGPRLLDLAFFVLDATRHPEDLRRLDELNAARAGITVVGP